MLLLEPGQKRTTRRYGQMPKQHEVKLGRAGLSNLNIWNHQRLSVAGSLPLRDKDPLDPRPV
jgi:hypothetical protein